MRHDKILRYDVLDEATSQEAIAAFEGMVKNVGVLSQYLAYDKATHKYKAAVEVHAYPDFSDDRRQGYVLVRSQGDFLFSTAELLGVLIRPALDDSVVIMGREYQVTAILYYAQNFMATDLIDNSYIVRLSLSEKKGMMRISQLG
jgi:hypothetical protein